jgi:hypothetical protein
VQELLVDEGYFFASQTDRPFILDCGAHYGVSIYFFKFGKWVAGGLSGVGLYMLRSGSFAVGAFIILAPLAIWAGRRLAARLPRLAESGLRQPRR